MSLRVAVSPVSSETQVSPVQFNIVPDTIPSDSILIYLALSGGDLIPMHFLESDSIESVKLRIQSREGFVVKNQKLVCGGRELARRDSLLREYGVNNGDVFHLVLRLSDLQAISVKTACGKEFAFNVERGRDVGYVKKQIAKRGKELVDLDKEELVYDGEELEDQWLIDDVCKYSDGTLNLLVRKNAKIRAKPVGKSFELSIVSPRRNNRVTHGENYKRHYAADPEFVPRKPPDRNFSLDPVISPKVELSSLLSDMIKSIDEGFKNDKCPVRSREGTGGAYFMQDSLGHKSVAVFKPIDEEPLAVNNPHGLPLSKNGEGLKKGTRVGEGALREVAAYILDHPKSGRRSVFGDERGFAGVPPTFMVKCLHKGFNHPGELRIKTGSLQMFIDNDGSCEDMGPALFPLEEVQKISVLDIRLANADRHAGNILFTKGKDGEIRLVPIDHGYCLPESFEDCTFDWLYWPQARKPYSPEIVEYIKSLDAEEDIALLKIHGWDLSLECARTLRISTALLKKGVDRGLTPYHIGNIMCRETLTKESVLEEILLETQHSTFHETSEPLFFETLSNIMDRHLDEFTRSL